MHNDRDNINDNSTNDELSSPSPDPPAVLKSPRERVEQARDLAIDLFNECGGMVHYAGLVEEHYLKLIHVYEIKEELNLDRGFLLQDIAWSLQQKMDRLQKNLSHAKTLIEPFMDLFDGVSAGPLTISTVTGSNAHITAIMLGQNFLSFFQRKGTGLMPLEGEGTREPNEFSVEQLVELLPKWRASARTIYRELLDMVGMNYEYDYNKWAALVRVEAGRALATMPAAPPMTEEEKMVIHTLLKGGNKPLIQSSLFDTAGLKDTGTNKAMLASMRQRGLLDNNGKGYFVPPSIMAVVAP